MEKVIKTDLLHSDIVEKKIQLLDVIQEELILRATGEYPAGELTEETISNLEKLVVFKRDLKEFKLNLDANCLVWREPEPREK